MSAKPKRPPLDKSAVRARLEHAREHQLHVAVHRWIPEADVLEGFVVAIGPRWFALQVVSDRIVFDGWRLARLKDVQAVSVNPDPDCFQVAALKARSLWPPTVPDVALDGTIAALTSAAAAGPLLTVFDEFARPHVCWIGIAQSLDADRLSLLEVDPKASWGRRATLFDPHDITRIEFGGGYEEALRLVAGLPPST